MIDFSLQKASKFISLDLDLRVKSLVIDVDEQLQTRLKTIDDLNANDDDSINVENFSTKDDRDDDDNDVEQKKKRDENFSREDVFSINENDFSTLSFVNIIDDEILKNEKYLESSIATKNISLRNDSLRSLSFHRLSLSIEIESFERVEIVTSTRSLNCFVRKRLTLSTLDDSSSRRQRREDARDDDRDENENDQVASVQFVEDLQHSTHCFSLDFDDVHLDELLSTKKVSNEDSKSENESATKIDAIVDSIIDHLRNFVDCEKNDHARRMKKHVAQHDDSHLRLKEIYDRNMSSMMRDLVLIDRFRHLFSMIILENMNRVYCDISDVDRRSRFICLHANQQQSNE